MVAFESFQKKNNTINSFSKRWLIFCENILMTLLTPNYRMFGSTGAEVRKHYLYHFGGQTQKLLSPQFIIIIIIIVTKIKAQSERSCLLIRMNKKITFFQENSETLRNFDKEDEFLLILKPRRSPEPDQNQSANMGVWPERTPMAPTFVTTSQKYQWTSPFGTSSRPRTSCSPFLFIYLPPTWTGPVGLTSAQNPSTVSNHPLVMDRLNYPSLAFSPLIPVISYLNTSLIRLWLSGSSSLVWPSCSTGRCLLGHEDPSQNHWGLKNTGQHHKHSKKLLSTVPPQP